MAYSALPAKIASDTLTLANYNAVKGNFEAGCPDIATTKGDLFIATAANAAARLGVGANGTILVAASGEATGWKTQIVPSCRVHRSTSNQTLAASDTWENLAYTTESWDTNAMWAVGNAARITIPANGGGVYQVGGAFILDTSGESSGEGNYGIRLVKQTGGVVFCEILLGLARRSADMGLAISAEYEFAAADYIEIQAYSSSSLTVLGLTDKSPVFWATWLRDAT